MIKGFMKLWDHFTHVDGKNGHAISSRKFLVVLLFVGIVTTMQWYGKYTDPYATTMQIFCASALAAFAWQDVKGK